MSWFKVDDQLHAHPKIRRAGLEALGLWVAAGSWASAYLTDGFVPKWWVETWPKGTRLAAQLVASGLWETATRHDEPGWTFHDFEDYNPASTEVEESRERHRERMREWRAKKAERRSHNGVTQLKQPTEATV